MLSFGPSVFLGFFWSQLACYAVVSRAIGAHWGRATHIAVCGGGAWEGTMMLVQLSASLQSLPLLPTNKLGPSGTYFRVGDFVYVLGPWESLQWTLLWGWEFLLLPQPQQIFFSWRFWGCISLCWSPGLCGLSCSPVVPSSLFTGKCGTAHSASHLFACSGPPAFTLPWVLFTWLPISALPTGLDECFFFNSLVCRTSLHFDFLAVLVFFFFNFFCDFGVQEGSVSTYTSILAGSPKGIILLKSENL